MAFDFDGQRENHYKECVLPALQMSRALGWLEFVAGTDNAIF
ncbi:MAG: hypothetical protein ACTHKU_15810 [Verrucomicrobiota bacterium]